MWWNVCYNFGTKEEVIGLQQFKASRGYIDPIFKKKEKKRILECKNGCFRLDKNTEREGFASAESRCIEAECHRGAGRVGNSEVGSRMCKNLNI